MTAGSPPAARPIVVGVDDSDGSAAAVRWAAREAAVRGVALRVVRAYAWGLPSAFVPPDDRWIKADLKRASEQIAANAFEQARACAPDVEVQSQVMDANPAQYLEYEAADAQLVVVGSHHLGTLGRAVLGSVSASVAGRAPCPVVVICSSSQGALPEGDANVVVGVDPEHSAQQVLGFAFDYARRHRRPLRPVMCWRAHPFVEAEWTAQWTRQYFAPERALKWLSETLSGWRREYPDVEVLAASLSGTRALAGGARDHPVDALVSSAAAQDLLVVGRHGRRARFGRLLGSVSQGVLHHAACPVAIIPVDQD